MRGDCALILAYDEDAGQAMLEALPVGPAGGASLIPADGIELIFDNADGWLSRVVIDAGQSSASEIGQPALAFIAQVFGPKVSAVIRLAAAKPGKQLPVAAQPEVMAALSRLSRLDVARLVSPVAESPLWAVETALLAARAGLAARLGKEARHAADALAAADQLAPSLLTVVSVQLADAIQSSDPELARRLRDHLSALRAGGSARSRAGRARALPMPDVSSSATQHSSGLEGVQWWLDPRLIPPATFQHALWPGAEMSVLAQPSGLIVEASLAPAADREALQACRARLVDPVRRRIIGVSAFHEVGGSRVRADIPEHRPPAGTWVEIVDDERRPVLSPQLRRTHRAMRWADAALAAKRQSFGLADTEWARVEALAWRRCADDWSAVGDLDRAHLAAIHETSAYPGVPVPPPPSRWASTVAHRSPLVEEPFLAERAA